MIVRLRQLGLAAFIRMGGGKLMEVEGGEFAFQTDKTLEEWRVEYSNSCCMKHDALVCELRHHLKRT